MKISFTRDEREDYTSWANERTILKRIELPAGSTGRSTRQPDGSVALLDNIFRVMGVVAVLSSLFPVVTILLDLNNSLGCTLVGMTRELPGSRALVTGASRGLGRVLTEDLARNGWRVIVDARGAAEW